MNQPDPWIDDPELLDERGPAPSPELARRVMLAVRRETSTPRPIPFPWRRFALAFAASVAVAILFGGGWWFALAGWIAAGSSLAAWTAAALAGLSLTILALRWSALAAVA